MKQDNPKLVIVDEQTGKINSFDENWYTLDGETFFPSVTTFLNAYPKGKGLLNWLKSQGFDADKIFKEAADQGSRIHNLIERFLKGDEIAYATEENCDFYDWRIFNRFIDFYKLVRPKQLGVEVTICDPKLGTGGTLDFPCRIHGEIWLIDHKSSNYIWHTQEIQLAMYVKMWNRKFPKYRIRRAGIMHLKAKTRTVSDGKPKKLANGKLSKVKPKIQGNGWQLHEVDITRSAMSRYYKEFKACQELWYSLPENKDAKPKNYSYESVISIKRLNEIAKKETEREKQELTEQLEQSIKKQNGKS